MKHDENKLYFKSRGSVWLKFFNSAQLGEIIS